MLTPLGAPRQLGGGLGVGGGGGFSLPYTFGGSSSYWTGSTFAFAANSITNTPATTDLLLSDPGLEGNYTSGKADVLSKSGSPTLAQSADVHGGSKAQEFTAVAFANQLYWAGRASVVGGIFRGSVWGKISTGTPGNVRLRFQQAAALPAVTSDMPHLSGTYTKAAASHITTSTVTQYVVPSLEFGSSAFATVIIDDGIMEQLTTSTCFALLPSSNRLATVKAQPNPLVDATMSAVVVWATEDTNPTDCLLAVWRMDTTGALINVSLLKKKGSTYTSLIAETALTKVADAWIEIRPVDNTTVALYYNNTQVSTNKTVADVAGDHPGLFITGDNSAKGFFVG